MWSSCWQILFWFLGTILPHTTYLTMTLIVHHEICVYWVGKWYTKADNLLLHVALTQDRLASQTCDKSHYALGNNLWLKTILLLLRVVVIDRFDYICHCWLFFIRSASIASTVSDEDEIKETIIMKCVEYVVLDLQLVHDE